MMRLRLMLQTQCGYESGFLVGCGMTSLGLRRAIFRTWLLHFCGLRLLWEGVVGLLLTIYSRSLLS